MINPQVRVGNFTSSEIWKLTTEGKAKYTFGAPALTYIELKNRERLLRRTMNKSADYARPISWGHLCEPIVNELLGTEYIYRSDESIVHPEFDFWVGTPDTEKVETIYTSQQPLEGDVIKTVGDFKCPFTVESYCDLVEPLMRGLHGYDAMKYLRENHKAGEAYYWQLVSNACIIGARYAELIVFIPYKDELELIRKYAEGNPSLYWLQWADEDSLPYIIRGGDYQNLNIIRFLIPEEDKKSLTMKVRTAGSKLKPRPALVETV